MKTRLFLGVAALALPALAVDHDNIDAGRPLDFDDAETIAFKEKAFELGGALSKLKNGKTGIAGDAELLYGFAKNWQLNLGIDPQFTSENGEKRRFDVGDFSVGVQHNFNRETEKRPAFGARFDAILPTGRGSRGTDLRLRAIVSRKLGRYGRLHFNADLERNNRPENDARKTLPGAILGYSVPLGFPTRFDRTLVAQIGIRAAQNKGERAITNLGIGIRQQVTPRSVLDLGIQSEVSGGGESREKLRLVAGYSTAF